VHGANLPVLVARGKGERLESPPKVLLASDQQGVSENATDLVRQFTFPTGSEGYVIHVIESLFAGQVPEWLEEESLVKESEPLSKLWADEENRNRQQAERELTALCRNLPAPFQKNAPVLLKGHPGEQILEFIEAKSIDLVVIGTRSQGRLARLFGGSTSEQVLVHAGCSVLVAPRHDEP
jgi:nucleotide-binding universal stress UspA family protein